MKEYFTLNYRITNRLLADFGIKPVIGYIIILTGFVSFSFYLFTKTQYAEYFYMLIALSFMVKLSEAKRNDFLKMCFSKRVYLKTRILENLIIIFPFAIFLTYKLLIIAAIMLLILAVLLVFINFRTTYVTAIPTPFYKKPFEFMVGFRNTFYLIAIAYCLTFIAATVNNFNLGIFALVFLFLIIASYYAQPENEYFVWCFNVTAKNFLKQKIRIALLFSSGLALPLFIVLGIFFYGQIQILLLFVLLYYLYLITIILAKYAAYPSEMNLMQLILLGAGFIFPPALIVIIPYLNKQAVTRLKHILG